MASWRTRAVYPVVTPQEAVMRVTEGLAQRGLIKKALFEVAPEGVDAVKGWLSNLIRKEDQTIIDMIASEIVEMRRYHLSIDIAEREFAA